MKRLILILPIIAVSLIAGSQTTQKLNATKLNEFGLIYKLPTTVVDVTIEAEKTIRKPGEFFRYAKKYLGADPITEPSVSYKLKSAMLNARGIADNEESYLVQFKSGSTPFMIINEASFPLAVNSESLRETASPLLPVARKADPTILETPAASQAITAEMLQSQSSAKKAELAAARIFELRQSRSEIISGTADNMPSDGQAMQLALDNLAAQEAALTAMFLGTTQKSTEVRTFAVTLPETEEDSWQTVVARLSAINGIVDADDLTGDPITMRITVTSRGQLPKNEKGEEKRFPKGGLAYRIPGTADIAIDFAGRQLTEKTIDVAQYGVVFGLDPNIFTDKKAPAYVIFNPVTGAIVEVGTK